MSYYQGPRGRFKSGIQSSQARRAAQISRNKQLARQRRQASIRRAQAPIVPYYVQGSGEKKGVDTDLTLNPILDTTSTNGSMFTLNLVQPGTASYNRVGRKIFMRSVRLRGRLIATVSAAVTTANYNGNTVRMVLVYDKQPNGVVPTFDTVFGNTVQDGTESTQFLDPVKYDNMSRFQVLRDRVYDFNPMTNNNDGGTQDLVLYVANFDEYVKLGGRETTYSGQSSPCTIADISTGALYVYFRAGSNTATTGFIQASDESVARLRYTD